MILQFDGILISTSLKRFQNITFAINFQFVGNILMNTQNTKRCNEHESTINTNPQSTLRQIQILQHLIWLWFQTHKMCSCLVFSREWDYINRCYAKPCMLNRLTWVAKIKIVLMSLHICFLHQYSHSTHPNEIFQIQRHCAERTEIIWSLRSHRHELYIKFCTPWIAIPFRLINCIA